MSDRFQTLREFQRLERSRRRRLPFRLKPTQFRLWHLFVIMTLCAIGTKAPYLYHQGCAWGHEYCIHAGDADAMQSHFQAMVQHLQAAGVDKEDLERVRKRASAYIDLRYEREERKTWIEL
jgi:hypothetical protein